MKDYPDRMTPEQARMFGEAEGVTYKSNGHVDMQRHLWEPEIVSEE